MATAVCCRRTSAWCWRCHERDCKRFWIGRRAQKASPTRRCPACADVWYFRRSFCPHCGSAPRDDRQASGLGTVHAVTLVTRAPSDELRASRAVFDRAGRRRRGLSHDGSRRSVARRSATACAADSARSPASSSPISKRSKHERGRARALAHGAEPASRWRSSAHRRIPTRSAAGRCCISPASASRARSIRSIPSAARRRASRSIPNLAALPEAPEVAIVVVAGDLALEAVEECARAGVKVAIVMASGFGEIGTPDGIAQAAAHGRPADELRACA